MSTATDVIQAVASLATVGVAAYAARLARNAASDWRSTLKQERADAALIAAADMQARIGRMKSAALRKDRQPFWLEYDASHRARASYRAALIACSRYFDGLDESAHAQIYDGLLQIEQVVNSNTLADGNNNTPWKPTDGLYTILDRVSTEVEALVTQLRTSLGRA